MKTLIYIGRELFWTIICAFALIAAVALFISPLILLAVFESFLFIFLYIPMFAWLIWVENKEDLEIIKSK
jgi:hypothetical protein